MALAEINFMTWLTDELDPAYLLPQNKPIRFLVDCGKTEDLRATSLRSANKISRGFDAKGYKLLPQECPVINAQEIVLHYTSTTYDKWCNE